MEMNMPDWATDFAIDPDGTVWVFEGGAFFEGDRWNPIDDYDGLRYQMIGRLTTVSGRTPLTFPVDTAAKMRGTVGREYGHETDEGIHYDASSDNMSAWL